MSSVEYTEQAIEQLEALDPHVADRVMNKIDEATDWTEHRLERLSGYPYYKLRAVTTGRLLRGIVTTTF